MIETAAPRTAEPSASAAMPALDGEAHMPSFLMWTWGALLNEPGLPLRGCQYKGDEGCRYEHDEAWYL